MGNTGNTQGARIVSMPAINDVMKMSISNTIK